MGRRCRASKWPSGSRAVALAASSPAAAVCPAAILHHPRARACALPWSLLATTASRGSTPKTFLARPPSPAPSPPPAQTSFQARSVFPHARRDWRSTPRPPVSASQPLHVHPNCTLTSPTARTPTPRPVAPACRDHHPPFCAARRHPPDRAGGSTHRRDQCELVAAARVGKMEHGACNVIYVDRRANDEHVRRETLSMSTVARTSTANVSPGYFPSAIKPPSPDVHANLESILSTFNQGTTPSRCPASPH